MPKSCTTAKRRNTTTNQAGMALWWAKGRNPPAPVPMLRTKVPTTRAQGHDEDLGHGRAEEDPADDALLGGVGRAVAGVVVAVLGPAEPAQRDGEGQRLHEALPVPAGLDDVQVGVRDGEAEHDGEEDHEGDDEQAQRLDDGGVAEEGQDALNEHGHDDEDDLGRVAGQVARLDHEDEPGPDDEDQALDLEADLGDPVEERDGPRPVGPEGRPVDGEDGRAGVRPLQRAQPEQEVGQVAEDDEDERPGRR